MKLQIDSFCFTVWDLFHRRQPKGNDSFFFFFCLQRLQCMLPSLEHAFRYKEGLVQRLVVQFLCIFTKVLGNSARVGA